MKTAQHGEDHPRLQDDRLPVVMVLLDGLGDRAIPQLGHQTAAEAARTPVLDRLTARGACGWHVPLGWGRAPSSELAHWAMFGYGDQPFPGRAVLEGLGAGLQIPLGEATIFASLRTSTVTEGKVWVSGRTAQDDAAEAQALLDELAPWFRCEGVRLTPLGRGEALLQMDGFGCGAVSDSDPFFEHLHPWLRVHATEPGALELAATLNRWLREARRRLLASAVNRRRREQGRPGLDLLTTKWSGERRPLPSFEELAGVPGAMVTDSRLYRGIATLLGMAQVHRPAAVDAGEDMAGRITLAEQLIAQGARFVHVHTKATDEAGHTKNPHAKARVLESIDSGLRQLETLAERCIVCVTGDHATPSVDGVLHTGDPTPLLVVGPTVRPDGVGRFGERPMQRGWFGVVRASELLPLLFSHANRPMFLGHKAGPRATLALPDAIDPMPDD